MTREEFFNNIKNVNEGDILPAFDSLMAFFNFYNAIGVYENVELTKSDPELASFDVYFKTAFDVDDFCNNFSGLNIMIYGVNWKIDCSRLDKDKLRVSLIL